MQPDMQYIDNIIENTRQYIDTKLMPIINSYNIELCGNLFTEHHNKSYTTLYIDKQKNFVDILTRETNIENVMEIGVNAGFSTLLMLMTNDKIKVTCADICEHKYVLDCYLQIKKDFGDRVTLHIGDSREVLTRLIENNNSYDLIHIDGNHYTDVAEIDIMNSYVLSKNGTIIIMDDYDCDQHPFNIKGFWDGYSARYRLQPYNVRFNTPFHDIKVVTNKWNAIYDNENKWFSYNREIL